jgi:DNA-binding CsgD family transcriptional regulator
MGRTSGATHARRRVRPSRRRQREVVRLVAAAETRPEIADRLQISHDSVRTHVRNAMTRLGARSRAHLVAKALGEGLVLE